MVRETAAISGWLLGVLRGPRALRLRSDRSSHCRAPGRLLGLLKGPRGIVARLSERRLCSLPVAGSGQHYLPASTGAALSRPFNALAARTELLAQGFATQLPGLCRRSRVGSSGPGRPNQIAGEQADLRQLDQTSHFSPWGPGCQLWAFWSSPPPRRGNRPEVHLLSPCGRVGAPRLQLQNPSPNWVAAKLARFPAVWPPGRASALLAVASLSYVQSAADRTAGLHRRLAGRRTAWFQWPAPRAQATARGHSAVGRRKAIRSPAYGRGSEHETLGPVSACAILLNRRIGRWCHCCNSSNGGVHQSRTVT